MRCMAARVRVVVKVDVKVDVEVKAPGPTAPPNALLKIERRSFTAPTVKNAGQRVNGACSRCRSRGRSKS